MQPRSIVLTGEKEIFIFSKSSKRPTQPNILYPRIPKMNRFEYSPAKLREDETFVSKDINVKLYDGDEKVHGSISQFVEIVKKNNFIFPDTKDIVRGRRDRLNESSIVLGSTR